MRYIVMAMPERRNIVEYLQANIPNLEVVWDTNRHATETWKDMLRAVGEGPAVVLEDDVVITKDFMRKAEAVIAEHPDVLIQFHSRTKDDLTVGARWRNALSFYNNQCLYYPAGFAQALLAYAEASTHWNEDPTGYDRCMAYYMSATKQRYWNSVPSLADHLPVVSQIDSRRSRFRVSTTFVDPEMNAFPQGVNYER